MADFTGTFRKTNPTRRVAPYFVLCVKQEKFGEAEFLAEDAITLGRDFQNAIWIDDPEVLEVHARLTKDAGGVTRLQCLGDATVMQLPENLPVHELVLARGVEFQMGSARITCEERFAYSAIALESPAVSSAPILPPPIPQAPAPPAECPRCRKLLSTMPRSARFCPKCGGDLTDVRAVAGIPAAPPLLPGELEASVGAKVQAFFRSAAAPNAEELHLNFQELQSILRGYSKEDLPPTLENVHSLILLGYANALLKLGWRYEHGRGVPQNQNEAARCYQKSAKLGNVFAKAKLGKE